MNWFAKKELNSMTKTSSSSDMGLSNQEGNYWTMGDVNRYSHDAYSIKIYISKTNEDCSVSLMASHNYLGTNQYSRFWKFSKNEYSKAHNIYEEISKIVKSVCEDFVKYEKPTSLFCPTLRERVQNIDKEDCVKTNIPHINYSYDIDYSSRWDKNIYGDRYPEQKEKSFKQYLNNSIYLDNEHAPSGKFAL